MPTKTLAVDLLRIDADTQSRVKINQEVVEDYTEVIEGNGKWPFPPLDVFHDGTDHLVADGFHRTLAAQRAKRKSVPCQIHKGTADDARIFGMTANDEHGLRPSRADKRASVEWLLDNQKGMLQKEIAEKAGVSIRTVKRIVADRKQPKKASPKRRRKVPLALSQPQRGGGDPFDEIDPFDEFAGEEAELGTEPPKPPRKGKDKRKGQNGKPPKQYPPGHWYKQWEQGVGPLVRLVDKIARELDESGSDSHARVQNCLDSATDEMMEWMGVKK